MVIINLVLIGFIAFKMYKPSKVVEVKETDAEREMREHIDALMNYTPEIAYRKVTNG